MTDLISKSALKADLLARGFYPVFVKHALETAPIIDAVEVVRCKDCICHNECKFEQRQGLDGFCSYGERKEKMNIHDATYRTKADHIRSMTDEELADFLVRLGGCADDASCEGCPFENSGAVCWTAEGIEKWLKQPYKEKET